MIKSDKTCLRGWYSTYMIPYMMFAVYLQIWLAVSHSAYSNYIKTAWQRYWADSECVEDVGGTSGWHSQIYDMGNHGKMSMMFSHLIVAFRSLPHVAQETCMT